MDTSHLLWLPGCRLVIPWLYWFILEASIILLNKSKKSVNVTEEFLVVVFSVAMMIVMSARTSRKSKGDHVLGCPWEVKSTVEFSQEESNNTVVNRSCDWMSSKKVQSNNGHTNFEHFFNCWQTNNFSSATFRIDVMLFMDIFVDDGNFVHQKVSTEKHDIIKKESKANLPEHLKSCGCTPHGNFTRSTRDHNVPDVKRQYIERELEDPSLPIPLWLFGKDRRLLPGVNDLASLLSAQLLSNKLLSYVSILQAKFFPRMNPPLPRSIDDSLIHGIKSMNVHKETCHSKHPLPMIVSKHEREEWNSMLKEVPYIYEHFVVPWLKKKNWGYKSCSGDLPLSHFIDVLDFGTNIRETLLEVWHHWWLNKVDRKGRGFDLSWLSFAKREAKALRHFVQRIGGSHPHPQ